MTAALYDTLIGEEIELNRKAAGDHVCLCPKCSHRREGLRDLKVTINPSQTHAHWKCGNCLWSGNAGDTALDEPQDLEPTIPTDFTPIEEKKPTGKFNQPTLKFFAQHGIGEQALTKMGVGYDHEVQVVEFNYFENTEKGRKVANVHRLTMGDPRNMVSTFEKGAKQVFYGIDAATPGEPLIIVRGELNALALVEVGVANVIATPTSAKASKTDEAFQYLAHAEELLKASSKIILAMPADKEGEALRGELARRIGAAKCFVIELPSTTPDVTHLVKTLGGDVTFDVINTATPFPITGLYEVVSFEESLLGYYEQGMASGLSTGWENVDEFYTVMLSEVDVVTGIPNNGKSEWLDALMINLAHSFDWRFAIFSPENSKEGHTTKLIEKRTQQPSTPGHPNRMTRSTFLSGAQWVNEHFVFILGDDEQNLPTLDWLLDRARSAVLRYGIKGLVLDPWNEIEHSRPQGMNETDYISLALSRIKRFARNHAVKVWIVAHPQKMQVDPKTGLHRIPSLYDISGSAHWANKVDNGIVIHRDTSADDTTIVVLRKVRHKHVGRKGETRLKYDPDSGTFSPAPDAVKSGTTHNYGEPNEGDTDIVVIEAP